MVAAEQDIGHTPAVKLDRAGVLRSFDEAAGETVVGRAIGVAQHSRQEAYDGIDENSGGECTVRENVISDGDLIVHEMIDDALIDPFIMTAQHDEMRAGLCVLGGEGLFEPPPAR